MENLCNQRYQLWFDADGKFEFRDENGGKLPWPTVHQILQIIDETHGRKSHLYLIGKPDRPRHVYKIGVTNDIERRAEELKGWVEHYIPCHPQRVYALEARLHTALWLFRLDGEWFELSSVPKFRADIRAIRTESELFNYLHTGAYFSSLYENRIERGVK